MGSEMCIRDRYKAIAGKLLTKSRIFGAIKITAPIIAFGATISLVSCNSEPPKHVNTVVVSETQVHDILNLANTILASPYQSISAFLAHDNSIKHANNEFVNP